MRRRRTDHKNTIRKQREASTVASNDKEEEEMHRALAISDAQEGVTASLRHRRTGRRQCVDAQEGVTASMRRRRTGRCHCTNAQEGATASVRH
ncbi:UNVERIFIED_CONTAM: hypothetical protein FKN15_006888 [Acipenser sinensis]